MGPPDERSAAGPTGFRVRVLEAGAAAVAAPPEAAVRSDAGYRLRFDGVPRRDGTAVAEAVVRAGGSADLPAAGAGVEGPSVTFDVRATVAQLTAAGREASARAAAVRPGSAPWRPEFLAEALSSISNYAEDRPRRLPGLHRPIPVGGRCRLLGIVNITPDSFSDGGRFYEPDRAVAHALDLVAEGAEIIDLGAESTRPGASEVSADAEWRRLEPVLARLAGTVVVPISVDTRHPEVAGRALGAGADLINDVSGLRDPAMRRLLARTGAPAIVMDMRGEPATMQDRTDSADVVGEVYDRLARDVARAAADGVDPDRLMIDPGLGFGKSAAQSLELLGRVGEFRSLGYPVVVGASRKSFLGHALGGAPVTGRIEAGIAAALLAASARVAYVRTHDVGPTARALRVLQAVRGAGTGQPPPAAGPG